MMLAAEVGVPKRNYNKNKYERKIERSCIAMLRTSREPLLAEGKIGKKVHRFYREPCWVILKLFKGLTGANSRKRQRSPDDDGDNMRGVSAPHNDTL